MAYLDDTGLAYFWGKIKAWAQGLFALIGHTHPSSDVTAMTGYSMPASTGAISSGDTLNQAVGKLEKAIDAADISNVVHLTGDETVDGTKTFIGSVAYSAYAPPATGVLFRDTGLVRGTPPSENRYFGISFNDASGAIYATSGNHGRFGIIEQYVPSTGDTSLYMRAYKNEAGTNDVATVAVGFENGAAFSRTVSTPVSNPSNQDIITRGYLNGSNSGVVHTSGSETVDDNKSFTGTIYAKRTSTRDAVVASGSQLQHNVIAAMGSDDKLLGAQSVWTRVTDGSGSRNLSSLRVWGADGDWADINIVRTDAGAAYCSLNASSGTTDLTFHGTITRAVSDKNGNAIDSTYAVDSNVVHKTGTETITGDKSFDKATLLLYSSRRRNGTSGSAIGQTWQFGYQDDSSSHNELSLYGFWRDYSNSVNRAVLRVRGSTGHWADLYVCKRDNDNYFISLSSLEGTNEGFLGNASTATKLQTSRTIRTNLGSTSTASFDGSANVTPGVTGTLPVANGGTGSSTKNFVDLSNNQTVGGEKTLTGALIMTKGTPIIALNNTSTTSGSDYIDLRYMARGSGNGATMRLRTWYNKDTYLYGTHTSATAGDGATLQLMKDGSTSLSACAGASGTRRYLTCGTGGTLTWNGQTVQTSSDERLKTPMVSVPDGVLDAWGDVEWGQFQFLDAVAEKGSGAARRHVGLIAQAVDRTCRASGVDILKYGILCHEVRETAVQEAKVVDREAYVDEQGVEHPEEFHIERDVQEGYDQWQARYVEALCMEAAYQRRENARLKKRVADLEDRLAALELRLGSE